MSLWGVQVAFVQSAVVVAGLVIALAVLNLVLWTLFRVAPQLYAMPERVSIALAASHLVQITLPIRLLRVPGKRWARAGLVMAMVLLATKEVALRWFSVDELYVFPGAAWAEDDNPVDVERRSAAQDRLMGKQVAALAPQVPGKPDGLALALGGIADQSAILVRDGSGLRPSGRPLWRQCARLAAGPTGRTIRRAFRWRTGPTWPARWLGSAAA